MQKKLAALIAFLVLAVIGGYLYQKQKNTKKFLASASAREKGLWLMDDAGCRSCHQVGSGFRAPVLENIVGKEVRLSDGRTLTRDASYLERAITAPMSEVVQAYQPVMPNYQGRFSPEELSWLIEAMREDASAASLPASP